MRWQRSSRTLVFIFWGLWATVGVGAFSIGLGGTGLVSIAAGQGFGPKLQLGGAAQVELVFPILDWLRVDSALDLYTVAPSDTSGGFLYRGYSGAAMAIMAQAEGRILSSPRLGAVLGGGGVGFAAALPSYWYTTLAFFYLEPRVEALLDWQPAGLPDFDFQLSLPLGMQLRRDMTYSASAGLGISAFYRIGAGK